MKNIKDIILEIIKEFDFCCGNETILIENFSIKEIFKAIQEMIDDNIIQNRECYGFCVEMKTK